MENKKFIKMADFKQLYLTKLLFYDGVVFLDPYAYDKNVIINTDTLIKM